MKTKKSHLRLSLYPILIGLVLLLAWSIFLFHREREINRLVEIVRDDSLDWRTMREPAARRLGQIGKPAVNDLVPLLEYKSEPANDYEKSYLACVAFVGIGKDAKYAAAELAKILEETDPWRPVISGDHITTNAAGALGNIGPEALAHLLPLLESKETMPRNAALRTLAVMGPMAKEAEDEIREMLSDPEPSVRISAVHALGALGPDSQSMDAIVNLLGDDALSDMPYYYQGKRVFEEVQSQIKRRLGPRAMPALQKAAESEEPMISERAKDLIREIQGLSPAQ